MIPEGSSAFLEQAHRNNWQRYLAALRNGAHAGWDVCVLTAGSERQAAMFRRQIAWRRAAGLLPGGTRFTVIADPGGRRIGSGGAVLRVLALLAGAGSAEAEGVADSAPGGDELYEALAAGDDLLSGRRVLVINSGGDSKRLPHCSATGKLFARVPRTLPDGRASTLFDEFLISLSGLPADAPPGVLVAAGDVLVVFDHLQVSLLRPGVTGVAAAVPAEMGERHGVYVSGNSGHDGCHDHRVAAYLHKPQLTEMAQHAAIAADGTVQIDTGLVWLDSATAARLAALAHDARVLPAASVPPVTLNLYGDLLLPLAAATRREAYLADTSDGPATPEVQAARRVLWDALRGTPLAVERLQPAAFVHFGSSLEYWRQLTADPALARLCGWTPQAAAVADAGPNAPAATLINSALAGPVDAAAGSLLLVDSRIAAGLTSAAGALVSGVQTARPLALGTVALVLFQAPCPDGPHVTAALGLADDPKLAWDHPHATYMGRPWDAWLAAAHVSAEDLWPGVPPAARCLWNARLHPVAAREASLALALPLADPRAAPASWRAAWLAGPRLSLAEAAEWADGERLLAEHAAIEDHIAVRRFLAAMRDEQPAVAAGRLLGTEPAQRGRRAGAAGAELAHAEPFLQMRGYRGLAEATGDPAWEDRAFATLAAVIRTATPGPTNGSPADTGPLPRRVRVEAAARVDFGGGWTDTPPYSLERGGAVLNAAVTLRGGCPVTCEAEWLAEPRLVLQSCDTGATLEPATCGEVLAHANPADPFALAKAAVVLRGIVPAHADPAARVADVLRAGCAAGQPGPGLRLEAGADIPRGSGLGTSSILAGAVLACLGALTGAAPVQGSATLGTLFDEVLCLEQMMTTGGGWQDQAGGLTGGIKLVTSAPGLPQRLDVRPLALAPATAAELADRLVLVYTGQQRLAKGLLRTVMRRWMARERAITWILEELARLAAAMCRALEADDVDGFGGLLAEHWALNRRIDPHCSNPFIDDLLAGLGPLICGGKLAGAGGGGFAVVVARDGEAAASIPTHLAARYPGTPVAVWPAAVTDTGIRLKDEG